MTEIKGIDISKWQGELSDSTVIRMIQAGIKFAYVKASQGSGSQDLHFEHNAMVLLASGMKVGAYHFVTNDRADMQYDNFLGQLGKFTWGLPPALDCEAYTSVGTNLFSESELMTYPGIFSFSDSKISVSPSGNMIGRYSVYGLAYPTQAVVDAIGIKLTAWMNAQPSLQDFGWPVIYTNASSGNRIFTSQTMSRYLLWVANWNAANKPPLVTPSKPAVWKNTPHFIWQYAVEYGTDFGDPGTQYDRDRWGPLMPFPDDEPEPPPPDEHSIEMTIKKSGKVYSGILEAK